MHTTTCYTADDGQFEQFVAPSKRKNTTKYTALNSNSTPESAGLGVMTEWLLIMWGSGSTLVNGLPWWSRAGMDGRCRMRTIHLMRQSAMMLLVGAATVDAGRRAKSSD